METRTARSTTRLVRTLALPTFGLALAMTVLTTYAPVVAGVRSFSLAFLPAERAVARPARAELDELALSA